MCLYPNVFSHGHNSSSDAKRSWDSSNHWLYGRTSLGVSGLVTAVTYSISYVSLLATRHQGLTHSSVVNKAGNPVLPSIGTVQNTIDAETVKFDRRFNTDLVDRKGAQSYPIVAYTYLIVRTRTMFKCHSAMELYRYIKWIIADDEASYLCRENGMIPLSQNLSGRILGEYSNNENSYLLCCTTHVGRCHHRCRRCYTLMQFMFYPSPRISVFRCDV